MSNQQYLVKQHNTWIVVVNVPPRLRKAAGQSRLRRSLKTSNLNEANRLKLPVVEEFKRQIEHLEKALSDPHDAIMKDAHEFREALKAPNTVVRGDVEGREDFSDREALLDVIREQAKQIRELHGIAAADTFMNVSLGEGTPIKDHYLSWIDEALVSGQTKSQHKVAIARYLEWAGQMTTIEETTRKKAGEYVSHLLAKSGLARRSIKRHLSSLSQFWLWLESKDIGRGNRDELDNVWLRHRLGKKPKTKPRVGLTDDLILKLLNGQARSEKYHQVLHDLTRLVLLTGARLDELCALKKTDVHKRSDGYWLSISDGKTDAAIRDVPLHKAGEAIVKRLLKSEGEYLFEGLIPGGPDEKRSWYVSKAYGRFRKLAGVDEKWQDFHALRNTFIGVMEGEFAPESTVKLIVGHARDSMTFGHYSKGERVKLREVIDRLTYSAEIMAAIRDR